MNKSLDKIIKKHIVLTALTGVAIVLLMITITYGLYQINHENTQDQEISLGDFDVDLTSSSGQITLSNLNPGVENNTTYSFTTSNSGDYTVKYNVYFTDNTTTFLADGANAQTYSAYTQITSTNYEYIEYKLDTGEYKPLTDVYDSTTGRFTIINGIILSGDSYTHTVKFRVSSSAPNDIQGSILALNITMEATATTDVGTATLRKLVSGSPTNSTDVITKTAPSGASCTNTLAYDNTVDNNLRYVGADPCNYVTFNGETAGWRIMGVMNNIDDGTGTIETRIKLIRSTSLGGYSWDTSASNVNSGYGVHNWIQADLMTELNGDYLDTTLTENTLWYNGRNEKKEAIFDITKRLSASAQNLIGNTKWATGGYYTHVAPSSTFYSSERCTGCTTWIGKVALMYPSDYGYAVGGEVRSTCLEKNLSGFYNNNCATNDYLFLSQYQWFLSPYFGHNYEILYISDSGSLDDGEAYSPYSTYPSVYLKSDVKITGGEGSTTNPYTLG